MFFFIRYDFFFFCFCLPFNFFFRLMFSSETIQDTKATNDFSELQSCRSLQSCQCVHKIPKMNTLFRTLFLVHAFSVDKKQDYKAAKLLLQWLQNTLSVKQEVILTIDYISKYCSSSKFFWIFWHISALWR